MEKNQKRAYLLALCAVLLWSTVATAFKITLQYLSPAQMVFLASGFSTAALLLICALQGKLGLIPEYLAARPLFYLGVGLVNPFLYYLILFKAYQLLPASQAQTLNYSWAITLGLLSVPFLGHRFRKQDGIPCALAYFGVMVIATQGELLALKFENPVGVALALLSTLLWAGYWIINTRNTGDPVAGLALAFMLSLPFSATTSLVIDGWPTLESKALISVGYVGLFEMGITFVLWLAALKSASHTARISNLIFLSPFISLVLLNRIIGEQIHPATVFGLLLIVAGLLIQNRATSTGTI